MKRILPVIFILAAGTAAFCALRSITVETRQQAAVQTAAWQVQTQQLARLYLEKQQVTERITASKQLFATLPPLPALQKLEQKVLAGDSLTNLSAAETEQLLAELGFNWNTTGDYVIISKKSLDAISYDMMKGEKLSAAGRGTLGITPGEQGALEALTGQLSKDHAAWAKDHVQRIAPSGDVVAKYSLPVDEEFSQTQYATYTNGIFNTLGTQRAQLMEDHSQDWMQAVSVLDMPDMSRLPKELFASLAPEAYQPKPITMAVERYQSGDKWNFNMTLEQGGGSMSTSIGPWQPFPEAFSSIFPGGWKELAATEGFELPAEFNTAK